MNARLRLVTAKVSDLNWQGLAWQCRRDNSALKCFALLVVSHRQPFTVTLTQQDGLRKWRVQRCFAMS